MSSDRELPELLRVARRRIEELPRVRQLEPIYWDGAKERWIIHCELSLSVREGNDVAQTTEWFVFVENSYPYGSIKFNPSKNKSLEFTYPHQSLNVPAREELTWRLGDLCLNDSQQAMNKAAHDREPLDYYDRLHWHFVRALGWLDKAASGSLLSQGEAYELPVFEAPNAPDGIFVFSENRSDFESWSETPERFGFAELAVADAPKLYFVENFSTAMDAPVHQVHWNPLVTKQISNKSDALWIRLKDMPLVKHWHVPRTYTELEAVLATQDIDLFQIIRSCSHRFRNGRPHLLLLGIPIPENVGDAPVQLHWQAIQLPILSHRNASEGFRQNEAGYGVRDSKLVFPCNPEVRWIKSQNWSHEQVFSRGSLPEDLTTSNLLIVLTLHIASTNEAPPWLTRNQPNQGVEDVRDEQWHAEP